MKPYALLIFTLLTINFLIAQNNQLKWAENIGATQYDREGTVHVDKDQNIILCGSFRGSAKMDSNTTFTSVGNADAFIKKVDKNGAVIWAKQIGISEDDYAIACASDAMGNIYYLGSEGGVCATPGGCGANMVILKFDPQGNLIWNKSLTCTIEGTSLAVEPGGTVYVAGSFNNGDSCDFNPGTGVFNLNVPAAYKLSTNKFVLKLDTNGDFQWVKTFLDTGSSPDPIFINTDNNGNLFCAGGFKGDVDVDPGSGQQIIKEVINGSISYNSFLAKLDQNGDLLQAKGYTALINNVHTDVDQNVLISGGFIDTFTPAQGIPPVSVGNSVGAFTIKMDNQLNYSWLYHVKSTSAARVYDVASHQNGTIYLTGTYKGESDFDPLQTNYSASPIGQFDIFITMLNSSGEFQWTKTMGSKSYDYDPVIAADDNGNLFVSGLYFEEEFYLNADTTGDKLVNNGESDIFFFRLGSDPLSDIDDTEINSNAIQIYPNPSNGDFTLSLDGKKADIINIHDVTGRKIYEVKDVQHHNFKLNVAPGIYFVQIEIGQDLLNKKIMIK